MHDHAGALRQHQGQERPIEADGRQEVEVEFLLPFDLIERGVAARRRGRAAQRMDDDVHAAEVLPHATSDSIAAIEGSEVSRDDQIIAFG